MHVSSQRTWGAIRNNARAHLCPAASTTDVHIFHFHCVSSRGPQSDKQGWLLIFPVVSARGVGLWLSWERKLLSAAVPAVIPLRHRAPRQHKGKPPPASVEYLAYLLTGRMAARSSTAARPPPEDPWPLLPDNQRWQISRDLNKNSDRYLNDSIQIDWLNVIVFQLCS